MVRALGRVVSRRKVGDYGLKRVMKGGKWAGKVVRGMRGVLGGLGLGGW
jgi:hypothetical protein